MLKHFFGLFQNDDNRSEQSEFSVRKLQQKMKESEALRKSLQQLDTNMTDINSKLNEQSFDGLNEKGSYDISSSYLQGLIDSLNSGNCSYVTYDNEAIRQMNSTDNITIVDKTINNLAGEPADALTEVIASKILNRIGSPTVYNDIAVDQNGGCKPYHLLSVNFLPKDSKFYTLETCRIPFGPHSPIWERENSCELNNFLFDYYSTYHNIHNQQVVDQMTDTFVGIVKQLSFDMLDRIYLLGDVDYAGHNTGVIEDTKNRTLRLAPNFDMEYCFNNAKDDAIDTLYFIHSHWPEDLKAHMHTITDAISENRMYTENNDINRIIDNTAHNNTTLTEEVKYVVNQNAKDLCDQYYMDIAHCQE